MNTYDAAAMQELVKTFDALCPRCGLLGVPGSFKFTYADAFCDNCVACRDALNEGSKG